MTRQRCVSNPRFFALTVTVGDWGSQVRYFGAAGSWTIPYHKLRHDARTVHPMAFSFPRAGKELFFPTVHVHDGQVHDTAQFDHTLYCQVGTQYQRAHRWAESPLLASHFMSVKRSKGLIDPRSHCYRKFLRGTRPNVDWRI